MEILAIIPARGGSKGIPSKNIVHLGGKPIIAYSIDAAKKSKFISRIVVSTDSDVISKIAKKFGAETPFIRPKKLSSDTTSTNDVIKHTLDYFKKNESYVPDIVVLLQPTSPLRNFDVIDKSIRKLKREKPDIILEVSKIQSHPFRSFLPDGKFLRPFKKNFLEFHQRQLFPKFYYPTGDLYVFWSNNFKKFKNIYGPKIQYIEKSEDEISHDINNLFDLFICEMKIKYWEKFQKQMNHIKNS